VREISGGVPVAIDCSGAASAQALCLDAARANGRVALLGIGHHGQSQLPIDHMEHLVFKELTVIGGWAGTIPEHFEMVDLIQHGMPVDRIITHRFGMEAAPTAMTTFFGGEAVKVIIQPFADEEP
jgi:threonine dehydrogenase-like Zn-dependent dehydrogenase